MGLQALAMTAPGCVHLEEDRFAGSLSLPVVRSELNGKSGVGHDGD